MIPEIAQTYTQTHTHTRTLPKCEAPLRPAVPLSIHNQHRIFRGDSLSDHSSSQFHFRVPKYLSRVFEVIHSFLCVYNHTMLLFAKFQTRITMQKASAGPTRILFASLFVRLSSRDGKKKRKNTPALSVKMMMIQRREALFYPLCFE